MIYNITDFGAVSDGLSLNTEAIQTAVDTCHKNGGGVVNIPSGRFVSGTIWLKSNVELHLEQGAVLIASANPDDFNDNDAYEQNFYCVSEEWNGKHFIIVHEQENVAITGNGTIDGQGHLHFGEIAYRDYYSWEYGMRKAKDKEVLRMGQLVTFVESKKLRVENVTMQNASCWVCFFHGCDFVQVRGVKIYNDITFGNTDGIDIDSCSFVTVSDCIIETGDDAFAVRCSPTRLKNSSKLCEYVTISNCAVSSYASGIRIGVGNGKIKNLNVSDIVMKHSGACINFALSYSNNSCSNLENVSLRNIMCEDGGFAVKMDGSKGTAKNIFIDNFSGNVSAATKLTAPENSAENITVSNLRLHYKNKYAELTDKVLASRGRSLFEVGNINGIRLENIRVTVESGEENSWEKDFDIKNCQDVEMINCKVVK